MPPPLKTRRALARFQFTSRRLIDRDFGGGLGLLAIAALIGGATAYAVFLFYGAVDLIESLVLRPLQGDPPDALRWLYPAAAVTVGLYLVQWLVGRAPGPKLQPLPARRSARPPGAFSLCGRGCAG